MEAVVRPEQIAAHNRAVQNWKPTPQELQRQADAMRPMTEEQMRAFNTGLENAWADDLAPPPHPKGSTWQKPQGDRNTFLDRYKHSEWPWIVCCLICIVGIVVMGWA